MIGAIRCLYFGSFTLCIRTWLPTLIQIRNLMATLHCAEHVHIVQTGTRIPILYFCIGQESKSVSISESVSSNVIEPFNILHFKHADLL